MGNSSAKMSDFQREKLIHEFSTFYDINGDGHICWQDFEQLKKYVCKLNAWPEESEKERVCSEVFGTIWETLVKVADKNADGKVSSDEWLLMWQDLFIKVQELKKKNKTTNILPTVEDLPLWCFRYLLHRFHLYDRTGDGEIDVDEYEYVLSHFNVSGPKARKAFLIFSENQNKKIDFKVFCQLASEYYFSNDPSDLGNFITGKLDFECMTELKKIPKK